MNPQTLYQIFVEVFWKGWSYGLVAGLVIGIGIGVLATLAALKFLSKLDAR